MATIKQVFLNEQTYDISAKYILDSSNVEKSWADIEALVAKTGRVVVLDELPMADADAYEEYKDALVLIPSDSEADVKDEYVIIDNGEGESPRYAWEKVGDTHIDLSDYAKKGTYESEEAGSHSHTATVGVNTYEATSKNLAVSRTTDVALDTSNTQTVITGLGTPSTDSVLGADATIVVSGGEAQTSKLVKTSIIPAVAVTGGASKVTVGTNAGAASKVTESTQTVAECDNAVSVATGLTDGTDLIASAAVSNGVLSFGYKSLDTSNIVPAKAKTIAAYTVADVDIPTVSASDVAVATVGTAVDVATGAIATDGTGASVATGISTISADFDNKDAVSAVTGYATPDTEAVLKGVSVSAQPVVTLNADAASGAAYVAAIAKGTDETKTVSVENNGAHTHDVVIDD